VLEISVNGQSRTPVPIDLAVLKVSGQHTIQTSIYMDQLGVKPYDIVSYALQAQRNGIRKLPATVSPVQFVEIKPLREDVHECPPTKTPGKCFNYITAIKSAQLRAMKENFVLAHSDLSHDSADWRDENRRVGGDQKTLAEKTGEVLTMLEGAGEPEEIVSLIRQARPEMAGAADKITATENEPALAPQGRALALITQVEQYLGKSARMGPSLVQKVPDPFDKKALQLKRRDQTPAGELETLAREQERLANDLATTNAPSASPAEAGQFDPGLITGSSAERETQINQRVGALLDAGNFVAEAGTHLEQGRREAQTSLMSLESEDIPSAREPAAASARELQLAADAMKRAAEQVAKNELADTLRALSDAASGARLMPAMPTDAAARQQASNVLSQVQGAARSLADTARQQQETGSAKAAAQLNELAQALAAADMQHLLQQLQDQPRDPAVARDAADKLQNIADRAGLMRQDGPLSPAQLAQLVDGLQRAQVNLQRLTGQNAATKTPGNQTPGNKTPGNMASGAPGGTPGAPASEIGTADTAFVYDLITVMREDLLAAVPTLPQSAELAQLRLQLREPPLPGTSSGNVVVYLQQIDPPLGGVIKLLQSKMRDQLRPFQLMDQEVAQAPPAYRKAVAEYYEKLSQDYHPAAPADHP